MRKNKYIRAPKRMEDNELLSPLFRISITPLCVALFQKKTQDRVDHVRSEWHPALSKDL